MRKLNLLYSRGHLKNDVIQSNATIFMASEIQKCATILVSFAQPLRSKILVLYFLDILCAEDLSFFSISFPFLISWFKNEIDPTFKSIFRSRLIFPLCVNNQFSNNTLPFLNNTSLSKGQNKIITFYQKLFFSKKTVKVEPEK